MSDVADIRRVMPASDLAAMSPAERHTDFEARAVNLGDLDSLPAGERAAVIRLLDSGRARTVRRIARLEGAAAAEAALRAVGAAEGAEARERVERLIADLDADADGAVRAS